MAFGHHLGAEEDAALAGREPSEDLGKAARVSGRVGIEPKAFEFGQPGGELSLEALGARAEARELGGPARRAKRGRRLLAPAVVAVEEPVGMQGERHVAGRTAERQPTGSAVGG